MIYHAHVHKALIAFDEDGVTPRLSPEGLAALRGHFSSYSVFSSPTNNGFIVTFDGHDHPNVPHALDQHQGVTMFPSSASKKGQPMKDAHAAHFKAFGVKKGASLLDALDAVAAVHADPMVNSDHV